jgi:hypothetical protein
MAKKKKQEQGYLIDIHPENKKEIISTAEDYNNTMRKRVGLLAEEKALKDKLLGLIKESDVKPDKDGNIKIQLDGFKISVTPRDELVQVRNVEE